MDIITETLAEIFIGPFQYGFMVRAFIVSILVGVMCPVLGTYVVIRGLGFMGDALAHSVLPGMVAAFLLGINFFLGAIPMAIAAALLIGYLIKRTGVREDTSVGIVFVGLFALGLVMATAAGGVSVNLEDILLGQVLAVSSGDVFVTVALAVVVLGITLGLHKELVFSSFDPAGAEVIGLPTARLEYLLLGLLSVVVVLALKAVGVILVISMLITPAATALLLVQNFARAMSLAVLIGVVSAVSGLYLSWHFNLPSGPLMALVATGFFVLAVLYKQQASALLRRRLTAFIRGAVRPEALK
jgi:manganese/iron transport system permease protein